MKHFPKEVTKETKLVVNPMMVLREEAEEGAILFDPDSGSVRILNQTATAIWKLLDGRRTLSEVVEALKEQFAEMDANAEDQVLALVGELYRVGAIGTITELSEWSR